MRKSKMVAFGRIAVISMFIVVLLHYSGEKALAKNFSYAFPFNYVGEYRNTSSEIKYIAGDSAYINCTWAEFEDSYFETWLWAYNRDDGNYCASYEGYILRGDQEAWVRNGATDDDIVWFRGQLKSSGGSDQGAIFEGRWRPDSSKID